MAAKTIAERKAELEKAFEEANDLRVFHEGELRRLTDQMLRLQGARSILQEMEQDEAQEAQRKEEHSDA